MNRRFFARKATGALAAIGAGLGWKAKGDVVDEGRPVEAPEFPSPFDGWPDGPVRLFLGYEIQITTHHTYAKDPHWIITTIHMNRTGGKSMECTVAKRVDTAELNRKIGTFCSPDGVIKGLDIR